MVRSINRLSAVQVAKLKVAGYYADGGNLYLQVAPSGSKSWIFRFTMDGKTREMGLGSAATFSLAEARERAAEQRKLLADGKNPMVVKREQELSRRIAEANLITFDAAAEKFIEAHEPSWKNAKHVEQWRTTLKVYASPVIGDLPLSLVDTPLVLRILSPIWSEKTETATRLRGRIERVLDWAKAQGYRSGENPAAWRGHLDKLLPAPKKVAAVEHHAALPWKEMGAFMVRLREAPGLASLLVELIILTATRTSEALLARWSEFDEAEHTWTIPATRMKANKAHTVPLSGEVLELLKRIQAEAGESEEGYLFPSRKGRPLSNMAGLAVLGRMGRGDLTVHGFRSTFRDWCAEATDYPNHVAEMALAHVIDNKTEAAYRRGELLSKRRALMHDWSVFCNTVPKGGAVVPIRSAA
jgi:integrase